MARPSEDVSLSEQKFNDLGDPICPQCGSEDTAPIHQEPMWASNDEPDPEAKDPPWYRCLACRHKWRTDR